MKPVEADLDPRCTRDDSRFPLARTGAIILVASFASMQFFGPELSNPPVVADLDAPTAVKKILRDSCYDCHSNETRLPWFDRVAPAYWKVVEDVRRGREHLNFSDLGCLDASRQKAALYESVNQIQLGAMPPLAYRLVHPGTVVSPHALAVLEEYLHPQGEEHEIPSPSPARVAPVTLQGVEIQPAANGVAFIRGYELWRAVSTTDRFDNGTIRLILANDRAIQAIDWGEVAPWPDGSVFAKVAWEAVGDDAGVVRPGLFRQVEFMVKDARKYAATQGWGWGRWLGERLTPYGDTPLFTTECTSCHAPMQRNDYVFSMPVRGASGRSDLLNTAAVLPAVLSERPLDWQVVAISVDKRAATTLTVYGNDLAVAHVRDGSRTSYPAGATLARITWAQREDPHWFGARIPDRPLSAELITVTVTAEGERSYLCHMRAGATLQYETNAPCSRERVDDLLGETLLFMPDLGEAAP